MPLEQVQFQVNIPQVLRLKYDEPKPCKNGSSMLSFDDDRVIFLEEQEAQQFARLGARRGDAVEFARQAVMNGKRIVKTQWSFSKPATKPAPAQAAKPETGAVQRVPERNNGQSITPAAGNGNGHAAVPPMQAQFGDAMQEFLILAGRATRNAELALGADGASIRFDSRDIAATATSMFIEAGKHGWLTWRPGAAR